MSNSTRSLGFRLITTSFLVVSIFIFVAGVTVYKISQDSIKMSSMAMVTNMVDDVRLQLANEQDFDSITDALTLTKIKQSGAVWLMDGKGFLLHHQNPFYRKEYIERGKNLGNIIVSLQYASPRASGTGSYKEKLIDIIDKYEEGFGTYKQFGETMIIAFRVIKDKRWLIALDQPIATAYSELNRIRKYILYTGVISAILIMVFTWLAIRVIVKPYYREVEELNVQLQDANKQLTDINRMLEISNKKLTALYKISISMQETLSLKDILDLIVSGAQEVLNADRINIMLPDDKETILRCRAAVGTDERELSEITVPLSSKGGALAASYKRGQVISIAPGENIPLGFRLSSPYADDPFLRSSAFVILPMVVKNKSVGVIAIDNKFSKRPITDEMVNLIHIFAHQAAVTVENARLYEELKKNLHDLDEKVDQLAIVNQISNTMQTMVKKSEMLGFILRGIKESMGFDAMIICLVDKEEDTLRGELGIGISEDQVRDLTINLGEDENPMALAASRGLPANYYTTKSTLFLRTISKNIDDSELKKSPGEYVDGTQLALCFIPIRVLDEVAGVIALGRYEKNPVIAKKEMELLMLFANTAGLSVERAKLYEKLEEGIESLEITDHVTKLYIFKYGQQRVNEEMIRSRDTSRPLSLLMLGIDKFKEFNDRCGQELGDKALSDIADMVKTSLSENDLAFRYGGRLVCCLLPGTTMEQAKYKAEEICNRINSHNFMGQDNKRNEKLTVSIGLHEYAFQEATEESSDLFKMSMAYLHRAEAAGGNQVFYG